MNYTDYYRNEITRVLRNNCYYLSNHFHCKYLLKYMLSKKSLNGSFFKCSVINLKNSKTNTSILYTCIYWVQQTDFIDIMLYMYINFNYEHNLHNKKVPHFCVKKLHTIYIHIYQYACSFTSCIFYS